MGAHQPTPYIPPRPSPPPPKASQKPQETRPTPTPEPADDTPLATILAVLIAAELLD